MTPTAMKPYHQHNKNKSTKTQKKEHKFKRKDVAGHTQRAERTVAVNDANPTMASVTAHSCSETKKFCKTNLR